MQLLREPLLHFAVAGALLFGAHAVLNRGNEGGDPDRIIRVTDRELAWLAETSARQFQRSPSEEDLCGLIAEYVQEEMLAREARRLELDRDDTVVRRRLAQKLTFLMEDTSVLSDPPEAELRRLYDAQPERFVARTRSSFMQVYFSSDRRGERTAADAAVALERLRARQSVEVAATMGDVSLMPAELSDADPSAIEAQFGPQFAQAVSALPAGDWQGPIASDFGLHLVKVNRRETAAARPFAAVRAELADEWRREREATARSTYLAELLAQYEVQAPDKLRPLVDSALARIRGSGS